MYKAVRESVTILPGGNIHLQSPDLVEGAKAEVIVLMDVQRPMTSPLSRMIGAGKGLFSTPSEADAFLSSERDASGVTSVPDDEE